MRDKAAVEHVVVRGDKEVKRDSDRLLKLVELDHLPLLLQSPT